MRTFAGMEEEIKHLKDEVKRLKNTILKLQGAVFFLCFAVSALMGISNNTVRHLNETECLQADKNSNDGGKHLNETFYFIPEIFERLKNLLP